MTSFAHKLGLGRLAYHLYHRPLSALAKSVEEGGPWAQIRTGMGRRQMEAAAHTLLPIPAASGGAPLEIHLLTGRRFWYQTAFCLWTLGRQSRRPLAPVIYDDGSLDGNRRALLARIFPAARFVSASDSTSRLDSHLPASRFPSLRERRLSYLQIRKLTDVHVGQAGWKLFIDSDLLFFHEPRLLVSWLDNPSKPLHATDVQNAYGYPLDMLSDLAGRPVAERLNTGLCGLRSEEIDWDLMEHWCASLIRRAGTHYYQEQALIAILLAGRDCTVAPAADYVTLPRPPEVHECRAVMHHYVAESKRWYFRNNWRRVLSGIHNSGSE
jgi:hypothetical protein